MVRLCIVVSLWSFQVEDQDLAWWSMQRTAHHHPRGAGFAALHHSTSYGQRFLGHLFQGHKTDAFREPRYTNYKNVWVHEEQAIGVLNTKVLHTAVASSREPQARTRRVISRT